MQIFKKIYNQLNTKVQKNPDKEIPPCTTGVCIETHIEEYYETGFDILFRAIKESIIILVTLFLSILFFLNVNLSLSIKEQKKFCIGEQNISKVTCIENKNITMREHMIYCSDNQKKSNNICIELKENIEKKERQIDSLKNEYLFFIYQ